MWDNFSAGANGCNKNNKHYQLALELHIFQLLEQLPNLLSAPSQLFLRYSFWQIICLFIIEGDKMQCIWSRRFRTQGSQGVRPQISWGGRGGSAAEKLEKSGRSAAEFAEVKNIFFHKLNIKYFCWYKILVYLIGVVGLSANVGWFFYFMLAG